MTKALLWWAVIWLVVGAVVYAFVGQETPDVLLGIGLAAAISLFVIVKTMSEQWEGEIIEVKVEEKYVSDDDGGSFEKRLKALVRLSNGKIKKVDAIKGYDVGCYLVKKRGEASVKVFAKKPD